MAWFSGHGKLPAGIRASFGVGLVGKDAKYPDLATVALESVQLTTEWQGYRIPLAGKDLSRIKKGFLWRVNGQGEPVTFYLDDIRFLSD